MYICSCSYICFYSKWNGTRFWCSSICPSVIEWNIRWWYWPSKNCKSLQTYNLIMKFFILFKTPMNLKLHFLFQIKVNPLFIRDIDDGDTSWDDPTRLVIDLVWNVTFSNLLFCIKYELVLNCPKFSCWTFVQPSEEVEETSDKSQAQLPVAEKNETKITSPIKTTFVAKPKLKGQILSSWKQFWLFLPYTVLICWMSSLLL